MPQDDFKNAAHDDAMLAMKSRISQMSGEEKLELQRYMLHLMKHDMEKLYYPLRACAHGLFSFDDLMKAYENGDTTGVTTVNKEGEHVTYTDEDITTLVLVHEFLTPGSRLQKAFDAFQAGAQSEGESLNASSP
jgi:hypothetical protein